MTTRMDAQHLAQLRAIFPKADPHTYRLASRLATLEKQGQRLGLRLCNGPEYPEGEAEAENARIVAAVRGLLGEGPAVFVNQDPRGYALKIEDSTMRDLFEKGLRLETDWGGYGIIVPELAAASTHPTQTTTPTAESAASRTTTERGRQMATETETMRTEHPETTNITGPLFYLCPHCCKHACATDCPAEIEWQAECAARRAKRGR
jgi:hypothetical protein